MMEQPCAVLTKLMMDDFIKSDNIDMDIDIGIIIKQQKIIKFSYLFDIQIYLHCILLQIQMRETKYKDKDKATTIYNVQEKKQRKKFQSQLEEQLNLIPKKQQFSNHKQKSSLNPKFNKESFINFQYKQHDRNQDASIFQMSSLTEKQNNLSPNSMIKEKSQGQKTSLNKNFCMQSIFDVISNKDIKHHLQKYFIDRRQIQLNQFIQMIALEYLPQQKLTKEYMKQIQSYISADLSTTNQWLLSLNALQILLKKTTIRQYFLQIILRVKYKRKKKQLQKDYNQIFNELIQRKTQIQIREEAYLQVQAELNQRRQELYKKQKTMSHRQRQGQIRQKQLNARQKNIKKILQQKHEKLMQISITELQKISKQLDKKIVTFQRNARNKLELIQKRCNQYKNILKSKSQSQTSALQKKDQQSISLRLKLKKIQKQFQQMKIISNQEMKAMQKESNNLLKANTILQTKFEKMRQKNKNIVDEIQKKEQQIILLKNTIQSKNQLILILERNVAQDKNSFSYENYQQKQSSHSNQKPNNKLQDELKLKSSRKKASLSNKKNKIKNNMSNLKQKQNNVLYILNQGEEKQSKQIQTMIRSINSMLQIIMTQFEKRESQYKNFSQNKSSQLANKKHSSLEQLLIQSTEDIFIIGIKVVQCALQFKVFDIEALINFLFKIYLAKCSFLRFQEINQILVKDQKYIQNFIQKIRHHGLKQIKYTFFHQNASNFINQYKVYNKNKYQNKADNNCIQLMVFMSMIGCNQLFDQQTQESVNMIRIIKNYVEEQIQNAQSFRSKKSWQNLLHFQQCELVTYMFSNFLQNHQTCSLFLQMILSLCNFYSSSSSPYKQNGFLLFKSISQLQNYKYLLKCMLGFQSHQQIMQKSSIILQRFVYSFSQTVQIDEDDIKQIKKLKSKLQKQKSDSIILANLTSIIQQLG